MPACLPPLPPLPTTVDSGSNVAYNCPSDTIGFFDLELVATAVGCTNTIVTGSGSATVTVSEDPGLIVTPPEPISFCEDRLVATIPVPFAVTVADGVKPALRNTIVASDGRECTRQSSRNGEWGPLWHV